MSFLGIMQSQPKSQLRRAASVVGAWLIFSALAANALEIVPEYGPTVPVEYRDAIEHACQLWKSWLIPSAADSAATVTLGVNVMDAGDSFSASASISWRDFSTGFARPAALALHFGAADAELIDGTITFNSSRPWHFDPATAPAAGQRDLVSTTLHEIGHQLGIAASYFRDESPGSVGIWGSSDEDGVLRLAPFDTHLRDENDLTPSTENDTFSANGNGVIFRGTHTDLVAPEGIPIYSPPAYAAGSSLSHVGFAALMAPGRPDGTSRRGLHTFEIALLRDLGWDIRDSQTTTMFGVGPVAYEEVGDTLASWHQGAHWSGDPSHMNAATGLFRDAGLPPVATTDAVLSAGVASYKIAVYEAAAPVRSLRIAGSLTSIPTLEVRERGSMLVGEDLRLAEAALSTGALSVISTAVTVGRDFVIGGASSARGELKLNEGVLDVGRDVVLAAGATARMENRSTVLATVFRANGGEIALTDGSVVVAESTEVQNGALRVENSSWVGGVWAVSGGSVTATSVAEGSASLVADTFTLSGGEVNLSGRSAINIQGAGEFLMSGGTLRLLGGSTAVNGGHFQLQGGAVTVAGSFNLDRLTLGSGTVTVHGEVAKFNVGSFPATISEWGSANVRRDPSASGDVRLTINQDGLVLPQATREVRDVHLTINGNVDSMLGTLALRDSATLLTNGDWNFMGAASLLGDVGTEWTSNGTVYKRGVGLSLVEPTFVHNGGINIEAGTLRIVGVGEQNGLITVDAGAALELNPLFNFTSIENSGTLRWLGDVTSESVFDLQEGSEVSVNGQFTLLSSGVLRGGGTLFGDSLVLGSIAPGFSPGTLSFGGDLSLDADAILNFELDELGASGDLLRVFDPDLSDSFLRGNLVLDGILSLEIGENFGAGIYPLIEYAGALEDRGLEIENLPTGYEAAIIFTSGKVSLEVSQVPEPGATVLLAAAGAMLIALRGRLLSSRSRRS